MGLTRPHRRLKSTHPQSRSSMQKKTCQSQRQQQTFLHPGSLLRVYPVVSPSGLRQWFAKSPSPVRIWVPPKKIPGCRSFVSGFRRVRPSPSRFSSLRSPGSRDLLDLYSRTWRILLLDVKPNPLRMATVSIDGSRPENDTKLVSPGVCLRLKTRRRLTTGS